MRLERLQYLVRQDGQIESDELHYLLIDKQLPTLLNCYHRKMLLKQKLSLEKNNVSIIIDSLQR